jgi:hypothetical protein
MSTGKVRVIVANIHGGEVKDLRRLVDLLCAIQLCWPSAEAEFNNNNTITVSVLRAPTTPTFAGVA